MLRIILIFALILTTVFFSGIDLPVFASDIQYIEAAQKRLSFLKDEDLSKVVFYSEYDPNFDTKLRYNAETRKLTESLTAARKHYEQSNVTAAYTEYQNIIKTMKHNDFYYMTAAYELVDAGFFSLAHSVMLKVQDKEIWGQHINFIRKYCFPKTNLTLQEEMFFSSLLSDIVYNNMTDESLAKFEKADKLLKNGDYAHYIRAKAYYEDKNYKDALNHVNIALSDNNDNILYKHLKAEILNASGKEREAIQIINQLQKNDTVFISIQKNLEKTKYHALSKIEKDLTKQKYYLACYFYLNRDYSRAITELNMLMLRGDNKNAPFLLGKIYSVTNKTEEAQKLYTKLILKNKKCAYAHKGLAEIFLAQKNYSEAIKEYLLADKYTKNDIDTLIGLSVIQFKLNEIRSSMKYLKKAYAINRLNSKVLYLKSKMQEDKGKQNLKLSICQNPLYPGGWLDLAQNALDMNDTDSAEEYINTAAFITKNEPRYFYFKSILDLKKQNYDNAKIDIDRAAEIVSKQVIIGETDENI